MSSSRHIPLLLLVTAWPWVSPSAPVVKYISPSSGGTNGGTRITVHGSDFKDSFNLQNDPTAGTRISLVGQTEYTCTLHQDGVTATTATCYTSPMKEGVYTVGVTVDGVAVTKYCVDSPDSCNFQVLQANTPTITSMTPRSGKPYTLLRVDGRLFTSRYGGDELSQNNREEKILKVWAAGQSCDLKDSVTNEYYGIQLTVDANLNGDYGYFKCLPQNDYIGNYNISFIVEGAFGRSMPQSELLLVRSNGLAMYQTYTEISELSAHTGSTEGGLHLQVKGSYFDDTDSELRVKVGDTDCQVISFNNTLITCVTSPASPTSQNVSLGNRGLQVTTVVGPTSFSGVIDWTTGDITWTDESYFVTSRNGSHVTKMEGAFVAPWDGDYQFFLRSDAQTKLSVTSLQNGTLLASVTSSSFAGIGQSTGRLTFRKGSGYGVQVLGTWRTSGQRCELSARHYHTHYLARQTGAAISESQMLHFRTTVRPEIQQIIIRAGSKVKGQGKVQTFAITGDLDAPFVLRFIGASTAQFVPSSAKAADIQTALNALPTLSDYPLTLTSQSSASGVTYTVTFAPELGDALSLELAAADVTRPISVESSSTQGQTTLQYFQLELGNTVTAPIPVGAKASDVQARLLEGVGVRCPSITATRLTGYEAGDQAFGAQPVGYVEPFCGRFSGLDPSLLYQTDKGIRITSSTSNKLCLAYKGAGGEVRIDFRYFTSPTDKEIRWARITFTLTASDRWNQVCQDIYRLMTTVQPARFDYILYSVRMASAASPLYVDEVVLLDQKTYDTTGPVGERRVNQMRPNGAFIKDVQVTGSANNYSVTLVPYLCGHDLELFTLAGSDEISGNTTADSFAAHFVQYSGGQQLAIDVIRVSAASKPVSGSFQVNFKNSTSQDIPVSADPSSDLLRVEDALTQLPELKDIDLKFSGDCSAFDYTVTMTTLPGDQPEMTIDGSHLGGSGVSSSVATLVNGYAWLRPLPGDMLRTTHPLPQVVVYVNDVPTSCGAGVNCSFTWRTECTPVITGVSPTLGKRGDVLTISGTGFADKDNEVTVGDVQCSVTLQTATAVVCTLSAGPGGTWPVKVYVPGKGSASGSATFTFQSSVSSISPSSGSTAGGLSLNISGEGFSSRDVVTIGGRTCDITSWTSTQIVCTLPAAATTDGGIADVIVSQPTANLSGLTFTYNTSLTPVITNVTPTAAHAWGGEHVTITGSGFTGHVRVFLDQEEVTITSSTVGQIIVELPPLRPRSYAVRLFVEGNGLADTRVHSVPNVTVTLKVTSVTPLLGSLYGGTDLTLEGQGFGSNASRVQVLVGKVCVVQEVTDTRIKCRVGYTGNTFVVTNQGVHTYYDFTPKQLSIKVGDCVRWTWTTPFFVPDVAFAIRQTDNDTSVVTTDDGFASPGPRSPNGMYTHCFNVAGDYSYWSGYLNDYNNSYIRGQVRVSPRPNSLTDIRVTIAGMEAEYVTAASTNSSSESGACQPQVGPLVNCTPQVLTRGTSFFQFQYDVCVTPYVTGISRRNVTTRDDVVLTGQGFGGELCQNEVTFGSMGRGDVSAVTSDNLTFSISTIGPPPVASFEYVAVRVSNLGNALVAVAGEPGRRLRLLPAIWRVTPSKGSRAGGTTVTLTGSGLTPRADSVMVTIGQDLCSVISASDTEVTCKTAASDVSANTTVSVVTYVGVTAIPVQCLDGACSFEYADDVTPRVLSVSPASINSSDVTITITGERFGSDVSNVTVYIGGAACAVISASDSEVKCILGNVPAGRYRPQVTIKGKGLASVTSDTNVTSEAVITQVSPTQGSIHGGTDVTITGFGFSQSTSVTIGFTICPVTSRTATEVTCMTSGHTTGQAQLRVTSNGVNFPEQVFTYSQSMTPEVTSVSPSVGTANTNVIITGSHFSSNANDNIVTIGNQTATVTSASTTSLQVTVGSHVTATVPVVVRVLGLGQSGSDITFTYQLGAVDISPTRGTTAGGQAVTLTGSGFLPGATNVIICQSACKPLPSTPTTSTVHVCSTPPAAEGVTTVCDVTVSVNNVTQTCASQYTYSPDVTPTVESVSPTRGGTAGGTVITVTGRGFGSAVADVAVMVGDVACDVMTVTDSRVTCQTNASRSGKADVNINIRGFGNAIRRAGAVFWYIDLWSSPFTWGGDNPPVEGDLVVIQRGQILLLDVSTPRLAFLLIQGSLIFDEANLELHADNILITDGGALQVGTEAAPFPANVTAKIVLHGHLNSQELPIYGTKVLALRNGTLDLHGHPTPVTWTKLAGSVHAGDTQISLITPVNWQVGDEVVLPSTGHRHSQIENEVRTIAGISADGLTLTLAKPLTYDHVTVRQDFSEGGQVWTLDLRGEVGLLTHNVKVQGSVNDAWSTAIPACDKGFDTGEFAVQTCFQGRFGAETSSDQFGAHIMAHAPARDSGAAILRLSYVQVSHAGQAFRLGRYPVHAHLNGDMSASYVRGLAIFDSFNRAVNIHGSSNLLVEHVVLYNIMGGAFFLEDGIETNNTFQYNLAVFVRPSSSLRNDDITPAAFWVTNPNNVIIHNAAAGGSHFGYWYRLKDNPEGPSFTANICPKHVPLGRFENNSAHSLGHFGLWIFENFFPHKDGSCDANAPNQLVGFEDQQPLYDMRVTSLGLTGYRGRVVPRFSSFPVNVAIFRGLTAWNCDKGAEGVNTGSVQFHDFVLVNNEKAGYEGKLILHTSQYDVTAGPLLKNARIVAHLGSALRQEGDVQCMQSGVVLPFLDGFMVLDTHFYNFNRSTCAAFAFTRIIGTCVNLCGGFRYVTKGLSFSESSQKVRFEWESEAVIHDVDGSLTGSPDYKVIPTTATLPPDHCSPSAAMSVGVEGSVCDDTLHFHRFAFNNILPTSLMAKNALFSNKHGVTTVPFNDKHLTHRKAWMTVLVDGTCYGLTFENGGQITNVSYDSVFYQFNPGDVLCLKQAADRPDRFMVNGATPIPMSPDLPDIRNASHGQWFYNETDRQLVYYIKRAVRRKRSVVVALSESDMSVNLRAYRCYYDNCQPPQDPVAVTMTPGNAIRWSQASSWDWRGSKPAQGENVTIPKDKWLIIDEEVPPLDFLDIQGGLSVMENFTSLHVTLEVNYIKVTGRLVVGWQNLPFLGKLRIRLRGDYSTPPYPVENGAPLGAKFIAVYGGLDLHGVDPVVKWTPLTLTAQPGDTTLTLADSVTWSVGDEVMVTTSDFDPWHTETFQLTAVAGNLITLNSSIQFQHLAYSKQLTSGLDLKLSSRVALLTRNIVIEGVAYDSLDNQSFGARVLVGRGVENGVSLSGFARLKNVEFYRSGQEGFTEPYDPRYSLAYVDVYNNPSLGFHSYVRDCTFHNGFSPAIGVFGVPDLEVIGNVIHHVVGMGIHTTSSRTIIKNNLVALTLWPGSYQGREESANIQFDGAVEATQASGLVLRGNVVAGCERVGYRLPGQQCSVNSSDVWADNEAHSCLVGVALFSDDPVVSATCVRFSGFRVWRNRDWGLYINHVPSQRISDVVAAENGAGFIPFVMGPSATGHAYEDKDILLSNSVFVGRTETLTCAVMSTGSSDVNVRLSSQARGWRYGMCGMTGVVFPSFTSGSNGSPKKPFAGIMAYPTIKGVMRLSNVTFALYKTDSAGSRDFAISTNPGNDDGQHPIHVQSLHMEDVEDDSKVFMHEPNLGKVNPSDCVDMDCDGLKKAMIVDDDGSLLGAAGYVLPNSAFQWNNDTGHGVGDFRIPKAMLTDTDGTKLDVKDIAPFKGIYGTKKCTWMVTWNAYLCGSETRYVMAVMESLDEDTETRRLSPVALLSGGYVDLINGPQDHGWCSGYTCRKRLSTFMALLPLGKRTDVYLTSTMPNSMRFLLLNAERDDCVLLSLWKSQPNRLDVYVNDTYHIPVNGYTSNGRFFLRPESTPGEFLPRFENKTTGDNYLSMSDKKLFWMMCGPDPIRIQVVDVIVLSMTFPAPAVSEQEFFNERIVSNIAFFFNIPLSKVRVANIVRDSTSSGRRRRSTDSLTLVVEIGDGPQDDGSHVDLKDTAERLVTVIQLNGLSDVVQAPVSYVTLLDPSAGTDASPVTVQRVGNLTLTSHPAGAVEGRAFSVQPVLSVYDDEGNLVTNLGSVSRPWQVQATLRSEGASQGSLTGTSNLTFVNGTAIFMDLAITLPGNDYIIDFNITYPPEAANYSLSSRRIKVAPRDIVAITEITTTPAVVDLPLNLTVQLAERGGNIVQDIAWRGHTWQAALELAAPDVCPGPLRGMTSVTFNPATGRAEFAAIQLSQNGVCPLRLTVTSNPLEYHLTFDLFLNLLTPAQRDLPRESSSEMELKFDINYDVTVAPYQAAVVRNYVNNMAGVVVTNHTYRSGSLIVSLVLEGTTSGVTSALSSVCLNIANGTTLTYGGTALTFSPYMSVNGASYYGVTCGSQGTSEKLHPGIIAAIVIACFVVVLTVVLILLWKLKVYPQTKTYDAEHKSLGRTGSVSLSSEDTFLSIKSRVLLDTPIPPLTTDIKKQPPQPSSQMTPELTPSVRTVTPIPAETPSTQRAVFAGPRLRPTSAEKLLAPSPTGRY